MTERKLNLPGSPEQKRQSDSLRRWVAQYLDQLEAQGNTHDAMFRLAEHQLAAIEQIAVNMPGVPPLLLYQLSHFIALETALVRALRANPMYGSRALRLQIEEQLEQILGAAPTVEIGVQS